MSTDRATAHCANCEAELAADDRFCGHCGQARRDSVREMGAIAREVVESTFSYDARVWRTLVSMVRRPGELTVDYLDGRRSSQVPPVRLYLFASVLLFFVLSTLAALDAGGIKVVMTTDSEELTLDLAEGELVLTPEQVEALPETTDAQLDAIFEEQGFEPTWPRRLVVREIGDLITESGGSLEAEVYENLSIAMFVFLPAFAGLLYGLHRKRRAFYIEHLVFSVHFHTVVFLTYALGGCAAAALSSPRIHAAVQAYVVVYLALAMRRVYGIGWGRTVGSLVVVGLAYGVLLILGMVVVLLASVVLL